MVVYLQQAEVSRPYPYILTLGDDPRRSFEVFVILAGQAWEQSPLLGEVDVCLEAFSILDINYPKQCAPAWEFLQKVCIKWNGDRESTPVKLLDTEKLINWKVKNLLWIFF